MHHTLTTIASAILAFWTIPGGSVWARVAGYFAYWVGSALAFVPVMRVSDRLAGALGRRFGHVATDESLREEMLRYRFDLEAAMRTRERHRSGHDDADLLGDD